MARRRYQRDGYLRVEYGGWRLTYRVYDAAGKARRRDVRIAEAKADYEKRDGRWKRIGAIYNRAGLDAQQAEQLARKQYLDTVREINQQPQKGIKVGEFWTRNYLPNAELRRLAPNTQAQYRHLYERWIEPVIGSLPLAAIEVEVAELVVSEAQAAGLSDETVRHVRKVGSAIFSRAIKSKHYSGFNPFQAVDLPRQVRPVRERYALSPEQARAVLDHELWRGSSPRYRDAVRWCLLTGMNIAEVCGLTGEHITEDRVEIRHQYYRGRYGPLKASSRKRDLPLIGELSELALPWVGKSCKAAGLETQYLDGDPVDTRRFKSDPTAGLPIFSGDNGRPINEHNVQGRYLRPIGKALGLPSFGWHVLRHTFATWLQDLGVSRYDRQRLLGHAGDMTDRYTHEDMDRLRGALESVARRLDGPAESGKVVRMDRRAG